MAKRKTRGRGSRKTRGRGSRKSRGRGSRKSRGRGSTTKPMRSLKEVEMELKKDLLESLNQGYDPSYFD